MMISHYVVALLDVKIGEQFAALSPSIEDNP